MQTAQWKSVHSLIENTETSDVDHSMGRKHGLLVSFIVPWQSLEDRENKRGRKSLASFKGSR